MFNRSVEGSSAAPIRAVTRIPRCVSLGRVYYDDQQQCRSADSALSACIGTQVPCKQPFALLHQSSASRYMEVPASRNCTLRRDTTLRSALDYSFNVSEVCSGNEGTASRYACMRWLPSGASSDRPGYAGLPALDDVHPDHAALQALLRACDGSRMICAQDRHTRPPQNAHRLSYRSMSDVGVAGRLDPSSVDDRVRMASRAGRSRSACVTLAWPGCLGAVDNGGKLAPRDALAWIYIVCSELGWASTARAARVDPVTPSEARVRKRVTFDPTTITIFVVEPRLKS